MNLSSQSQVTFKGLSYRIIHPTTIWTENLNIRTKIAVFKILETHSAKQIIQISAVIMNCAWAGARDDDLDEDL